MNTLMDQLRTLNQRSTEMDEKWLLRLQFAGSGTEADTSLPEIVLPIAPPSADAQPKNLQFTDSSDIANENRDQAVPSQETGSGKAVKSAGPNTIASAEAETLSSVPAPIANPSSVSCATGLEFADLDPDLAPSRDSISDSVPENPPEWLNQSSRDQEDRTLLPPKEGKSLPGDLGNSKTDSRATSSHETRQLVDRIVDRFPSVASATIMFVSVDNNLTTQSLAADTALCLAERDVGSVLLVDADLRKRGLSEAYGSRHLMGVTDIVNRNEPMHSLVRDTDCQGLCFLPAGQGDVTHRKLDWTRISRMTLGLSHRFRYTLIGGGSVGELLTDCWAAYVDGVYLILGDQSTDRDYAQEAVAHLRSLGARTLGCILLEQKATFETA